MGWQDHRQAPAPGAPLCRLQAIPDGGCKELRFGADDAAFSLLLFAVILLLLVFAPGFGMRINGARRWVRLGIAGFQSVEAVKLLFVFYLAAAGLPGLLSSRGPIRLFGLAVATGLAVALAFYEISFISVWCFFAALASIAVMRVFVRAWTPTPLPRAVHRRV